MVVHPPNRIRELTFQVPLVLEKTTFLVADNQHVHVLFFSARKIRKQMRVQGGRPVEGGGARVDLGLWNTIFSSCILDLFAHILHKSREHVICQAWNGALVCSSPN